jgi:CO/xanthine dehydrogenase Mo-binding subunit
VRCPGPYRIANLKIDSYCVYTNTPTCGAYRGPAGPQLTFASESQIDIIARELGIDPVEMRLRNAFENGDETPAGARLKDVHASETLRKAAAVMNERPKPDGENIGRGLAVAHWLVGGMASSAGVKLNEDGTIGILTGVVDLSGASTSLAQIAAEVLGVSLDDVHVRTADTDFAPHSTISAGSQASRAWAARCCWRPGKCGDRSSKWQETNLKPTPATWNSTTTTCSSRGVRNALFHCAR